MEHHYRTAQKVKGFGVSVMRSRIVVAAAAVCLVASSSATTAQNAPADDPNPPWKAELSRLPTPRTADGKPDLGGLWRRDQNRGRPLQVGALNEGLSDAKGNVKASFGGRGADSAQGFINYERDSTLSLRAGFMSNLPLYRPQHWERVRYLDDNANWEDPEIGCKPEGVPRMGPPERIVQTGKELFLFYNAAFMTAHRTYRIIPMNKPLPPVNDWTGLKWAGTSSARWEGDTLVIETVDLSENSWLDSPGFFHTADMRVTERVTRQGNVLTWQATVTDPEVLLQPWVQNPWYLRLSQADPVGEPQEVEPCADLSRGHFVLKNHH
jgi:hypothetical protein